MLTLAPELVYELAKTGKKVRWLVQLYLSSTDSRYFVDGDSVLFGYPPSVLSVNVAGLELDPWTRETTVGSADVVFRADGAARDAITSSYVVGKGLVISLGVDAASVAAGDFLPVYYGVIDGYEIQTDGTVVVRGQDALGWLQNRDITGAWVNKHPIDIVRDVYLRAGVPSAIYDADSFDSTDYSRSISHWNLSNHSLSAPTNQTTTAAVAEIYRELGRRKPVSYYFDISSGNLLNTPSNAWEIVAQLMAIVCGCVKIDGSGRHALKVFDWYEAADDHFTTHEIADPHIELGVDDVANRVRVDYGASGLTFGAPSHLELDDDRFVQLENTSAQSSMAFPASGPRVIERTLKTDWVRTIFYAGSAIPNLSTSPISDSATEINVGYAASMVGLTGARWRAGHTQFGSASGGTGTTAPLATTAVSVTSNVATATVSESAYGTVATTAVTVSANVATATVAAGHRLDWGQWITTSGLTTNATTPVQIVGVTATSVSFALTASDGAMADGTGTINIGHGIRPGDYITTTDLATNVSIPVPVTSVTATTVVYPLSAGDGVLADGVGVIVRQQHPADQIAVPVSSVSVTSNVATGFIPLGTGLQDGDTITTFGLTTNATDVVIQSYSDGGFYTTITWNLTASDGPLADGTGWVRPSWRRAYLRWGDEILRISYVDDTYIQTSTFVSTRNPLSALFVSGASTYEVLTTNPRETSPMALTIGLERAQLGTTAAAHTEYEAIYDITIPYEMGRTRITRESLGAPRVSWRSPISKVGVEIGDQITGAFRQYARNGKDGADNTTYFEVTKKQIVRNGTESHIEFGGKFAKQTAFVDITPGLLTPIFPVIWVPRPVRQDTSFLGSGSYGGPWMTTTDNSTQPQSGDTLLSVSFWFEVISAGWPSSMRVFGKPATGQFQFGTTLNTGGRVRFTTNNATAYTINSTALSVRTQYHYCATYNAGTVTVYINGVDDTGATTGTHDASLVSSTSPLHFFGDSGASALLIDVRLSNLCMFVDTALTAHQVSQIYNGGRAVDLAGFPGLTSWWTFNFTLRDYFGRNDPVPAASGYGYSVAVPR